jgi:hypothetical protein
MRSRIFGSHIPSKSFKMSNLEVTSIDKFKIHKFYLRNLCIQKNRHVIIYITIDQASGKRVFYEDNPQKLP